jgi:DNA-binding MarR family transcriptional regulator
MAARSPVKKSPSASRRASKKPLSSKAVDVDPPLRSRPGFLIRRLNQIAYALFFEEFDAKVTPVQYGVLTALAVNGFLDQNSIGEELGLDRTNVTQVLTRLENRGWVARRPNPDDRRAKFSYLTPKGRAFLMQSADRMRESQDRILAPFKPKERETFMRLLNKLIRANNEFGRSILRSD